MEKNENTLKANRILYIVIVAVLCITALVIGITAAMQKDKKPSEPPSVTTGPAVTTATPSTTAPPPVTDSPNTLPSFVAPAAGEVAKGHDLSVLVYSATMDDLRVHAGIDICANIGDDVLAAADGEITKIYTDPMMGCCIEIAHAGDAVSVYKNLSIENADGISVGEKVKKGQVISYIGDTAMIEWADEPHLHYELLIKGVGVDPMDYISEESKLASLTQGEFFED